MLLLLYWEVIKMTDMTNYRAALACQYASENLKKHHTAQCVSLHSEDLAGFTARDAFKTALEDFEEAAGLLGFTLVKKDDAPIEPPPTPDASLLQDIDDTAPNYSAGLSGRLK